MTTLASKLRSCVVRGIAVTAVVLTYAVGSVGTQVIGAAGLSSIVLGTSTTPADAQWWRGRWRGWRGGGGWRGWRGRRWWWRR